MFHNPDYQHVIKWRYLDSLDSTRFSESNLALRSTTREQRFEQACFEVFSTILMGNGIIVTNNQLFDSFGFLRIASGMMVSATQHELKGKHVFFPLKYSNYDYSHEKHLGGGAHLKDPYLLVAYLLEKDGVKHSQSFELSAWPKLGGRRLEWAQALKNECMAIPDRLIGDEDYYEGLLAEDLIRILLFFKRNPSLITPTASTKNIRETMVRYVAGLTEAQMESDPYLQKIVAGGAGENDNAATMMSIANAFKKLGQIQINDQSIIDNRSELRKAVFDHADDIFDSAVSLPMNRLGVLETLDSIYNFTSYISTGADQDNQTEPMDDDSYWGFDEASFTLGQWAREKYMEKNQQSQDDLSATQDVYINPRLTGRSFAVSNLTEFWNQFFDYQCSDQWVKSLSNYLSQLRRLEELITRQGQMDSTARTSLSVSAVDNQIHQYKTARNTHIDTVNAFLKGSQYEIVVDKNETAWLIHVNVDGQIISKTQIEDFSKYSSLTKQDRSALHAKGTAEGISAKGRIAEYGE